ncbi:ABC transporter permease [Enterococcus rivorum]|uniref:Permease n=1 Tax=Enterococcus rivorum TaxID=762845 RepID=A0A1E5KYX0_9ENTE|nr:ABC transporter permease [Enterococcus rivorum]MBP2097639.1 putative ABC transport system permease protein [Enterococcus rivorum]OEH83081.1 permease [Enterococcus rivorum]
MKFSDILKSASSNLMRNKGRTILTIVAIFIGAFTISLTTGVNNGVNDYIDKQVGSVGGENQLFVQPKMETGMGSKNEPAEYDPEKKTSTMQDFEMLNDKDFEKIKKVDKINKVEPMKSASIDYIEGENAKKYIISAMGTVGSMNIDLETGNKLDQNSTENEIILAPEFVKTLGYKSSKDSLGKTVKLATSSIEGEQKVVEAKIVGVRNASLIQGGMSLMNNTLLNQLVEINQQGLPENMKNQYSMVIAETDEGTTKEQMNKVKEDLDKIGYEASTIDDEIGMLRNVINAITGVLTMFGAIALLAASFGIINTLFMSVQERTREIGLMKAMGLSSFKIFTIFSIEAVLIGFFGSVLGILGAMGAGSIINKIAADSFLDALTGFTLLQFSPVSSGIIVLIIMGIAFLAGTLPARRAAKLDPIDSLRYE